MIDWSWFSELTPWLQGAFGGAGAILLWEGILKPNRERRSLANALAEEVSLNLQYATGQRLYIRHSPKGLPADFALCDIVFKSVAPRLGELPRLAGEVTVLYHQIAHLNQLPATFSESLRLYQGSDVPNAAQYALEMDSTLSVYRTGLEKCVERANLLLPKLRRASIAWYRIDRRLRKPKLLSLDELARDVDKLAELRRKDRLTDKTNDEGAA